MQVEENTWSFGIRKKLFVINIILLTVAVLAGGFAISEFMYLGSIIGESGINKQFIDVTIQNVIIIQASLATVAVSVNGYSFIFARSLTKPIFEAANIAKKISEG